jgi:hypothetical protein
LTKIEEKIVDLITLVANNEVTRADEKMMLMLCLSEMAAFVAEPSIQDAIETLGDISKGK